MCVRERERIKLGYCNVQWDTALDDKEIRSSSSIQGICKYLTAHTNHRWAFYSQRSREGQER